ncbi:MAG: molybdopterin molybdotransferase MoeA [Planctomycetes bacterium]|nr:molybdopterin molybdotransferase MoeA [Planctomycetota bacterium]
MVTAISLFEARSRILAADCRPRPTETVSLDRVHGRFLAAEVRADGPWPATDRSAMDGFAVAAGSAGLAAGIELPVVGESLAGHPFPGELAAGAAIRIMTGAVVPVGADAVVPVEHTSGFGGHAVTFHEPVRSGQNVRPKGSEITAGQPLLAAGCRLRAAEIGALAVLGHASVAVRRRVRVAIVATGDEVVPVENVPEPYQVRESNSWALAAQVHECGGEGIRLGVAPDQPDELRRLLLQGLEEADVLITIGGISKGTHDLVRQTLEDLGVSTVFHGVQLKPGKPTFFGTRAAADGAGFVFGLPGNPMSCFTVFDLLVRPLLLKMVGADPGQWRIELPPAGMPWRRNARWQAVPARLAVGEDGRLAAELGRTTPSGDPFGLLGGNLYGLLPADRDPAATERIGIVGGSTGIELP